MIRYDFVSTNVIRWLASSFQAPRACAPRLGGPLVVEIHKNAETDNTLSLCLSELEQSHAIINWYDDAVMRKKSWSVAIWVCVTAFGVFHQKALVVLLGLTTMVGFALSELVLRRYQRRYVVRTEELERMLVAGDLSSYHFAMSTTPARSDRWQEIWYALVQPHFTLYYGLYGLHSVGFALFLSL